MLSVWPVDTSSADPSLKEPMSSDLGEGGNEGFFTSISSNGASNVIIWAVSRTAVNLYAFQPDPGTSQLKLLNKWSAGNWELPYFNGKPGSDQANSNIVPVVANGHVYVASYKELAIFGFQPLANAAQLSNP